MVRRIIAVTPALMALALLLCPACAGKKKPAQDPKLVKAGKPLEGKWREVKEFGGSNRTLSEMPIMVLGKTSYTLIPPKKLGNPTLKGTWRVKEAKGKKLIIGLTLDLGGKPFKGDDQRVKIIDADTLEWRNAKNGHGGIFKRIRAGAVKKRPTAGGTVATPSGPAGEVLSILAQLRFGKSVEADITALLGKWKVRFKRQEETEPTAVKFRVSEGPKKNRQVLPAGAHSIDITLQTHNSSPVRLHKLALSRPPFGASICRALAPYYRSRAMAKSRCELHRDKKDNWRLCLALPDKKHLLLVECTYNKEEGDALEVSRNRRK